MKNLMYCRRTFIATFSIILLTALGLVNKTDVSMAIATIAVGLAGANAYEKGATNRTIQPQPVRYGSGNPQ